MNSDEELLDAIAYQARVAYATQQLDAWQTAVQHWQRWVHHSDSAVAQAYARHKVAHCTEHVARWQHYLTDLEQPRLLCAVRNEVERSE